MIPKALKKASAVLHDNMARGIDKRKVFSIPAIGINSTNGLGKSLSVLIYSGVLP
jgi:hypothetical protein